MSDTSWGARTDLRALRPLGEAHLRAYVGTFAEVELPEGAVVVFQATHHDTPLNATEVRELSVLLGRLADGLERDAPLEDDLQAFTMVVNRV